MFEAESRKKGVYSKSVRNTFYRNRLLVGECILKLVCHLERAGYRILVLRKRYRWKTFEEIVTDADLKKQPLQLFCRKRCSLKFCRKTLVLENLFNNISVFHWICQQLFFKNTCIFVSLYLQLMKKMQPTRRN